MSELPRVRDQLLALEPILHRLPTGSDRAAIDALLEHDYFEVGASGSVYTRTLVIDVVEKRYRDGENPMDAAWSIDNFHASTLAEHLYLVTYRLSQSGRVSQRATVWRRHDSGWKAVYHQGTLSRH
ncbi:DUF4440 domain-containing protein [Rhodococcus sp. H29-C3]|uniref:nuclear transport factor 2 family protein n=1 Tax=Rhodococcus sp. H29-C3 TaxID=3046307 RepID=UPI0024BA8975|nr:DUF4440 domain-containing protein [Rhodococcus sp. H29-C3]MDJ0362448.1 DUF4440 domain-containing protein [Rhodococcus sp. H29-C3]